MVDKASKGTTHENLFDPVLSSIELEEIDSLAVQIKDFLDKKSLSDIKKIWKITQTIDSYDPIFVKATKESAILAGTYLNENKHKERHLGKGRDIKLEVDREAEKIIEKTKNQIFNFG